MARYTYLNLVNFIHNKKRKGRATDNEIADFFLRYASGETMKSICNGSPVSYGSASKWRREASWFEEALSIAREIAISRTDGKMSKLLESSLDSLQSRLDRGDPYIAKDGSVKYKPVTAHHAAQITSIIFDKRALLRNQPTTIKGEKEISTEERLNNLGKRFEEMGKLKIVKNGTED